MHAPTQPSICATFQTAIVIKRAKALDAYVTDASSALVNRKTRVATNEVCDMSNNNRNHRGSILGGPRARAGFGQENDQQSHRHQTRRFPGIADALTGVTWAY